MGYPCFGSPNVGSNRKDISGLDQEESTSPICWGRTKELKQKMQSVEAIQTDSMEKRFHMLQEPNGPLL